MMVEFLHLHLDNWLLHRFTITDHATSSTLEFVTGRAKPQIQIPLIVMNKKTIIKL